MQQRNTPKKRYVTILAAVVALILAIAVATPALAYYVRTGGKSDATYDPAPLPPQPGIVENAPLMFTMSMSEGEDTISNLAIRVVDNKYPVYVRVAIVTTWQRLAPCECEGCKTVEPDGCENCEEDCTDCDDCTECTDDCEKCKVYPKCGGCVADCVNCADCVGCDDECGRCKFFSDDCENCKYCKDNCMPKEETDTPVTQADGDGSDNTETEAEYCPRCNGEVDIHFSTPTKDADYKLDINEKFTGISGNEQVIWARNVDKDGAVTEGYDGYWYYTEPLLHTNAVGGYMQTPVFIKECALQIQYVEPDEEDGTQGGYKLPEGSTWPGEGWYLNVEIIVQTIQAIGFTDDDGKPAWKDAWANANIDSYN